MMQRPKSYICDESLIIQNQYYNNVKTKVLYLGVQNQYYNDVMTYLQGKCYNNIELVYNDVKTEVLYLRGQPYYTDLVLKYDNLVIN